MGTYIHFTDEQKRRANAVDLEDFLLRQGEQLIRSGREWRWKRHDSVTVRSNQWFRHSRKQGGLAINFVREFYNLSFPEAVTLLLGGEEGAMFKPAEKKEQDVRKPFILPEANSDMRRVFAYLNKRRFIDRDVLFYFARERMIYESRELSQNKTKEYHNAVFVGYDENGVARHAHKKGVYSNGNGYRGNVEGGNASYSFHYTGTSDKLYVFEAPIDLLSFVTLYPEDWTRHSYVALDGVAEHAMLKMLELTPSINHVILCLDHDAAGIEAAGRLAETLRLRGGTNVSCLQPQYKDWNEDLKARNGVETILAEEHPQTVICTEISQRLCQESKEKKKSNYSPQNLLFRFEQYRTHLHQGRTSQAEECLEDIANLSLAATQKISRQIGCSISMEQLADELRRNFLPHQNCTQLKSRNEEISKDLLNIQNKASVSGIRTETEMRKLVSTYKSLALSCVKGLILLETNRQKLGQDESQQISHGISL